MADWAWDPPKAVVNEKKHGVTFELASLVFLDPMNVSEFDPHPDADRWTTIGRAAGVILFVSHTLVEPELQYGRIISARRATAEERKRYAQGSYA